MYSCEGPRGVGRALAARSLAAVPFLLLLAARPACAAEFDAAVAPNGRYLLKLYPKIFYTSAYFNDRVQGATIDLQA